MMCSLCGSDKLRLSRLRRSDLAHLLFFSYPIRCIKCFERRYVNLIAACRIGLESRTRQRQAHKSRNAALHHSK